MPIDKGDKTLRFEASARLQRLFGRDLIPDDDSAVEELIKNAYDSNATEVNVTIVRPSGERDGEIEIKDNGWGLSLKEFERVWMYAGYSEKTGQPLPHSGRIQVGEKGIGRFAADKLGHSLEVITKPQGQRRALQVTFDWRKFENKKRLLSEIPIPYATVIEDLLPPDSSGTILRIRGLRAPWPDKAIEGLRRRLSRLLNPYDTEQKFRIVLKAPSRKLSGAIVPSEIKGSDFEWDITRNAHGRVTVRRRQKLERDSLKFGKWETRSISKADAIGDAEDFGPVRARFFFFVDRPKKSNIGDSVAGVAVYRDGLRVEPAGSSNADWLGLLEKRAKRAGHMTLVPSRLFGFVEISREDNPTLQDATNRRSFIHGPQLEGFRNFLKRRLDELESQVEAEVAKPRWEQSRRIQSQKLIQARHTTLSIMSLSLAHELRQPLQSIQTASENIVVHLAREGVSIPAVDIAADAIRRNVGRIDRHIRFLKSLGSGGQEEEQFDLVLATEEAIGVLREYATARNIEIINESSPAVIGSTNRGTFLATLSNLILNACQAIEEQGTPEPHTIRVGITTNAAFATLRVVDDGPGIPEANRSRLFKRQTTSKQGGMGVGLLVWREALQVFGGDLTCERFGEPTVFAMTIPIQQDNGTHSTG
jgi:signal transduction histidine kinase